MPETIKHPKIITICCLCNKVRNAFGQWHICDTDSSTQTDDVYSHGYCPDCVVAELEKYGMTKPNSGSGSDSLGDA